MKRLFFTFALPTALLLYGIAVEAPIQLDDGPVLESARTIHPVARWLGFTSFWFTHKAFTVFGNIFPWRPEAYHRFGNILIHAIAATALFWLVKELSENTLIASIAGALFLVHPVETQAVTYISQRFESMAAMWMIISAAAYVRFRKSGHAPWIALVVLAGVAAVLSKETAGILPIWVLLIELCFFSGTIFRTRVKYVAPLALLFLMPAWSIFRAAGGAGTFTWIPWHWYFASQGPVLAKYLQLSFWPRQQFLYYEFPPVDALTFSLIAQWLLVIGVIAAGILLLKRERLAGFGLLSFFVLLLPVTLVPLPDLIFEHRVYPAFAGIAIAVAALCRAERKALLAGMAVILVFLCWRTIVRNSQWNDEIAFMEIHRAEFPHDPDILARLGSYYYAHGYVNKALDLTLEARKYEGRFNPYYSQARKTNIATNLVAIYFAKQDVDAALTEAKRAIALDPEQPMALRAVATVEMSSGHYAAARDAWQRLTTVRPEDFQAWLGLKQACGFLHDVDGAAAADLKLQEFAKHNEQPQAAPQRPLEISAAEKTRVIFSLTVGVLILLVLAGRTIWAAVNQQKLRIRAIEGRQSS